MLKKPDIPAGVHIEFLLVAMMSCHELQMLVVWKTLCLCRNCSSEEAKKGYYHPLKTIKFRNPILMTCHYPDTGGTSVWACRDGNLLPPIHQKFVSTNTTSMEFLHSFLQQHFVGSQCWHWQMSAVYLEDLLHCVIIWLNLPCLQGYWRQPQWD